MSKPTATFIGSYDKVLECLDRHASVARVLAPRGRLRNMRLEKRLRDSGVEWLEVTGREHFLDTQAQLLATDYAVVAGFSWRLPDSLIQRFPAVINCHPGDLLRCRGPEPVMAALYHGHELLGACLHLIDSEAMDAGPLLARATIDADFSKPYNWHHRQVIQLLLGLCEQVFAARAAAQPLQPQAWEVEQSQWHPRLPLELRKAMFLARSIADFHRSHPLPAP